MASLVKAGAPGEIDYPDSDGEPMADNTRQARWIAVFHGNLDALLRDERVFVAMNLLWYAKEGFPEERAAPDVFLAFGRPRGERGSYKQWEEDDVAPQVVIEVRSPGNSDEEMARKHLFYEEHGVEDYFLFDPDSNQLHVFRRKGSVLVRHNFTDHHTDPRLGIRFDLTGEEMQVFYPDGRRFLTFEEVEADRSLQQQLRIAAEQKLQSTAEELQTTTANLRQASERASTAEQQLQSTADELQSAAKELQTTRQRASTAEQQLQSTAEELQSTAEELQSTTEELQTTRQRTTTAEQKLQSAAEELQTTRQRASTAEQKLQSAAEELQTTAEELQTIRQRATAAEQRSTRLAELTGKLLRQQATPEEILELQQLLLALPS